MFLLRTLPAVLVGVMTLVRAVLAPRAVAAQAAQAPEGRIEGMVRNGTQAAALDDGEVQVTLIRLQAGEVTSSEQTELRGGRYEFTVEASPEISYVLRTVYRGVQYFAEVVLLSSELPTAVRDLTVYETSREAPPLSIEETSVTLIALDRAAGTLTLVREDSVRNSSDRVYLGDPGGVTLRIPVPDATLDANGIGLEGDFNFEDGVVTTTTPLRPGVSSVLTSYIVAYDRGADRYLVRITAPVDADRLVLRIPESFLRAVKPDPAARRVADEELEGVRLSVFELTGVRSGQALTADLVGLSGPLPASNPLAGQRGAAVGTALTLVILSGGVAGFARLRGRVPRR